MNPKSTSRSLMCIASGIDRSNRPDPSLVISSLNSIIASSKYEHPPGLGSNASRGISQSDVDEWVKDHREDAIVYVADWYHNNIGHDDWSDNPGFDWKEGLPKYQNDIIEEDGYEYRTSLVDGIEVPKELSDGFELVQSLLIIQSEPVYNNNGRYVADVNIGKGCTEAVYRRLESNES